MSNVKISIYRFNPEVDKKPYMQDFVLNMASQTSAENGGQHVQRDMMLLDALIKIKDEQDETLTFRRSCGEGVCGSDGMNINGQNGLACIIPLSSLKTPVVIRPLPGFPVIRDLVVDMTQFYEQYEKAKPFLINDNPPPAQERLQTPEERSKLDGLYECILCACCTSSCPSYWWNPDKFLGPAALLWAYRFIADSRDTDTQERLEDLEDPYSLFRCRTIMNCASVCPKHLNPSKAINHIRSDMLQDET